MTITAIQVLSIVLFLTSVCCRNVNRTSYDFSTVDIEAPKSENLRIFTLDEYMEAKVEPVDSFEKIPRSTPSKEKTNCLGPITLMALCFWSYISLYSIV